LIAVPDTMRAWLSQKPGMAALTITDQPCPRPGSGEALIRVETAALNFSDLLMIDDRYQVRPPRPFVPGQEIAGTVVATSEGCTCAIGDRVAGKIDWGGFAEYAILRDDMAIAIPANLSTTTAAALPVVYTTAMVALTQSTHVSHGETVLVLAAAGGVGLAAVEIAHALGARVIAAAGGDDKGTLAREHGADATIDYRADGWSKAVKALTDGRGVDVIVDPVGGDFTREALRALAWEGRLLVVGFAAGDIPMIPANRLLLNRASAIGVYWNHDRDAEMLKRVTQRLAALLEQGAIRPHIGNVFAFNQLPDALAALAERRTTGKAILTIADKDARS
jgi:NADPH2:quinone reductase